MTLPGGLHTVAVMTGIATSQSPQRTLGDPRTLGPVGRLGRYAATHVRAVVIGWAVAAVVLAAFAPKVETALSGAGWEAAGSESVQARKLIQQDFAGASSAALTVVVHSPRATTSTPAFAQTIARVEH